jgi:microcystin-dependent protein
MSRRNDDDQPLLSYAVRTIPDPVQASPQTGDLALAELEIVVSNEGHDTVVCTSIAFDLPVGENAKDFLAKVSGVGTAAPKGWSLKSSGTAGLFIATPDTPSEGEVGGDGITFKLFKLPVNRQPGPCHVIITEEAERVDGPAPAPPEARTLSFQLAKFPYAFRVGKLTAKPARVNWDGSVLLEWSGSAGATYELQYDDVTVRNLPATGSHRASGLKTNPTIFYLVVTYTPGAQPVTLQRFFPVAVGPPPPPPAPVIKYFRPSGCDGTECFIAASEFILEWQIENARSSRFQLTRRDATGVQAIPVAWGVNSILVKPTEFETEYIMTVENEPPLTATVRATLVPPVPVGTITALGGSIVGTLPVGWFYCNGQEVSGAQYPDLRTRLGETHGRPQTSGNVKLPDLRGYFLRGADDGRGIDPGRAPGSVQQDAFASHTHGQKVTANPGQGSCTRSDFNGDANTYAAYDQGVQTDPAGGNETRPKNIACFFIIYAGVPKPLQKKKKKKEDAGSDKSAASKSGKAAKTRRGRKSKAATGWGRSRA